MAGYQRFVAYVYEYLKGKKGSNCGFIKVEVRDQRCRLELHLQCPGIPAQADCRIFGFVRNGGLMDGYLLGICKTGDGTVQCMIETDALNMNDSGIGLGKMGGLIMETDGGAFFGTEWDDIPIRPENFREVKKNTGELPAVLHIAKEQEGVQEERVQKKNEVVQGIEEKENTYEADISGEEDDLQKDSREQEEMPTESRVESIQEIEPEEELVTQSVPDQEMSIDSNTSFQPEENMSQRDFFEQKVMPAEEADERTLQDNDRIEINPEDEKRMQEPPPRPDRPQPTPPPRPNRPQPSQRPLQGRPGDSFLPFGDEELMDCRKIQIKDLARLNRRDIPLRNNRFLQYGYYNFGHLLICRRADGRYILGVPGGYDQQERFMANMFGFPYFKESRYIQLPKGRGGYWYRLINTPDFH